MASTRWIGFRQFLPFINEKNMNDAIMANAVNPTQNVPL